MAARVQSAGKLHGLDVEVQNLDNPRKEAEDHYYNAAHSGLMDLGLEPCLMSDEVLGEMLAAIIAKREAIDERMILPRVRWKQ